MLPIVDTYQLDRDLVQDRHVPGLPLGTRGGTRAQSHLPLDGEYVITVQFTGAGRCGRVVHAKSGALPERTYRRPVIEDDLGSTAVL